MGIIFNVVRLNESLWHRLLFFVERNPIFIDDCVYQEDLKKRLKEIEKFFPLKLRLYLKYMPEAEEILFYHITHLIEKKYVKPKNCYPNKDWEYEDIGLNFLELSLKGHEYLKETRRSQLKKIKGRLKIILLMWIL